mmetsp:Transcript_23323/g.22958  ORF Transcript_23323/g.22958 Transcript_23323/m.22958 type:complete len:106 (-) Transcript_23323:624-941(-)
MVLRDIKFCHVYFPVLLLGFLECLQYCSFNLRAQYILFRVDLLAMGSLNVRKVHLTFLGIQVIGNPFLGDGDILEGFQEQVFDFKFLPSEAHSSLSLLIFPSNQI